MMVVQTRTADRIPVLLRKIYTDLKNPASFSSPYHLYAEAKTDKFENKVAGCHRVVGDTEVLHSSLQNQNQVQKEKGSN